MKLDAKNDRSGSARILSFCGLCPSSFRRSGFTLMELLLVMVLIAILGTIIMGSAKYVTNVVRKRRAEVACAVLKSALTRYRSDYNKWPNTGPGEKFTQATGTIVISGADNADIFGALRENSDQNKRKIRYFDETTLYTVDAKGNAVSLRQAGSGDLPLVYAPKAGGSMKYFKVVINVDIDTVSVSAPELDANP